MRKKSVRSNAGANLRRKNNKNAITVRTQRPQWKLETLEPKVLLSADGAPGVHRIEGSIDQPGEQDVFEFVVTEKTRFFFDGISGEQMSWQLQGSNTTDSFGSRTLTSVSERFLDLNAGSYRLTVDATGDRTGAYVFRMIGEEGADRLTPGVEVSGTMQPGTQAHMFKVDLQVGDRVFFQNDVATGSNTSSQNSGQWSLFDPDAVLMAGPTYMVGPAIHRHPA